MDNERPWSDLPQGIIETILNKLHFVDQVRALAVCKTWRDSKDYVRCSDTLPWVICIQHVIDTENGTNSFIFKLIDPYSRQVIKLSKLTNIINPLHFSYPLSVKNGWMLIGGGKPNFFLYNPFTNGYIHLNFSLEKCEQFIKATISVDPTASNWELFIGGSQLDDRRYLFMETYKPSGLTSRSYFSLGPDEQYCRALFYMKGNVYCLSFWGCLHRYCVENGEWDFLTSDYPEPYDTIVEDTTCWLMEINENLVLVCMDSDDDINDEWRIFKFDWSKMSWVVENSLKSCAIYISCDVAFSTPLTNQSGEKLEGCKLFYHDGSSGFKCYYMCDAGGTRMIQSEEYDWITGHDICQFCFIEPPYFRS